MIYQSVMTSSLLIKRKIDNIFSSDIDYNSKTSHSLLYSGLRVTCEFGTRDAVEDG